MLTTTTSTDVSFAMRGRPSVQSESRNGQITVAASGYVAVSGYVAASGQAAVSGYVAAALVGTAFVGTAFVGTGLTGTNARVAAPTRAHLDRGGKPMAITTDGWVSRPRGFLLKT